MNPAFSATPRTIKPPLVFEKADTVSTTLFGSPPTVYHLGEKLAALQRVALTLQEAPPGGTADQLAMSRSDLLSVVGQTLPELNLDGTHAKPLLDEIVDRSQLLIPRSVATITGAWPLGPEWLAWLSLAIFAVSLILHLVLRQKEIGDSIYVLLGQSSLYLFACSLCAYGVVLAVITIIQWIGGANFFAVWLIMGGVTAMVDEWKVSVNANVLRRCLDADRQVRLGRRSVIAGSQAS